MFRIYYFLAIGCLSVFALGATVEQPIEHPKLSLNARATISVSADELQISLGVVSLKDTAEAALADNNTKMQKVISALEASGLANSEYKTGRFDIRPVYTPYPKDPPPNWKAEINGYEVTNSIVIKTEKLDLAGKLIDAASKAGANRIDNMHFGLRDFRMYWDKVLTQATQNAKSDAEVIAAAANVKLLQLLSVSLESAYPIAPQANAGRFKMMAAESAGTPIKAEDVELEASVSVVYEIGH